MRLFALIALLACASASAQKCENLIALSKTVTSTVADKSAFEQHAATFCSEYKKSGSSSASTNAGASFKFISASFGQANMSADEVASKVCSASSGQAASADAYKQYVETIAKGAFPAYETCVRLQDTNDLKFDVDTASLLPAEFTIVIGYAQAVQGATTAALSYSASQGVTCTWDGKTGASTTLTAPASVPVKCSRADQSKAGYAKFTRTNGVGGSLTIPWPAFDNSGVPVATLQDLNTQFGAVQQSVTEVQKQLLALTTSTSQQIYICPAGKTPGVNPGGGAWGFYGCQGQVTTQSTCVNIEYPWSEIRTCSARGQMKLY